MTYLVSVRGVYAGYVRPPSAVTTPAGPAFSPFEAWSIKEFLGLPEQAGLEGLKKALRFRMYARINVQSIIDDSPNSIISR